MAHLSDVHLGIIQTSVINIFFAKLVKGLSLTITAQKMKFSIKDFFSKWSHLLKKSLTENFIFCVVYFREKASP